MLELSKAKRKALFEFLQDRALREYGLTLTRVPRDSDLPYSVELPMYASDMQVEAGFIFANIGHLVPCLSITGHDIGGDFRQVARDEFLAFARRYIHAWTLLDAGLPKAPPFRPLEASCAYCGQAGALECEVHKQDQPLEHFYAALLRTDTLAQAHLLLRKLTFASGYLVKAMHADTSKGLLTLDFDLPADVLPFKVELSETYVITPDVFAPRAEEVTEFMFGALCRQVRANLQTGIIETL